MGAVMNDVCLNCNATITPGSTFKLPNPRKSPETVAYVNFIHEANYPDLCEKCSPGLIQDAYIIIDRKISEQLEMIQARIVDYPMFTMSWLPASIDVRFKGMITANVTVGTGFFSEFSQGFSDFTGAVNVKSGMSHKVNKGEAAARSILVEKAMALGANCIIGVDIDYGTTANNAATINMQGTAALVSNLEALVHIDELAKAHELQQAYDRVAELRRWSAGQILATFAA
ncbi:hypothetical protein BV87_09350 [Sphingobium yanoikuyae]|uniref:Heavy metal-binding domain-containing protein n=2 Tax=Sphingobium yanoikuyae TaxID=13690 RepID=A0A0J9CYT7_SPHYA|nr:hypothetical protein BV87_09350 [Sphingobium yanoikuyae]KMW30212.1 hypothetical protein BV87_07560 [Sphingobium yanoikuyae]